MFGLRYTSSGIPDVDGLPFDEIVLDGDCYMRRYYLERGPRRQIRLHHILRSDAGRDLHDHPWDFTSILLAGAYLETTLRGTREYRAPCVLKRKAHQLHRLTLHEGPVWSYVICGPIKRSWGFHTEAGWTHHLDYKAG